MSEKLPDSWKRVKLGEVGKVITGTTPSKDNPNYWGNEIMFITPTDYKNYKKWAFSSERKLSKEGEKALKNKLLPPNSIMVTCIGSDMGKIAMNFFEAITNQQINSIIVDKKYCYDFIYYQLKSMEEEIKSLGHSSGSALPILNKSTFENLEILIPEDINEQKAIAGILSSLDDKIDLLHRQNKTLEEMAQTLFRKWFIEDAQEDWEEVSLGDIVEIKYGKNLPTSKLGTEGYPVFGGSGIIGYYINYLYEEPQVLVSCRGSGSGKVIISEPYSFITNNSFILERSKNDWFSFEFLKYWALNYDFSPYISGSAQPQITINDLFDASIILPKDKTIIRRFSILTKPIEEKILKNKLQIRTLEQLRDTLLPKLMSGEVRVRK
jgi:type I restriction enzyme S subunit